MSVLCFAGSLRKDSFNKKLALEACRLLKGSGTGAEFIDLRDYPMPVYDGDVEALGLPQGVLALGQKIRAASALVIATPEYNGSISGMLKNTIDWLSREKPVSLSGKHLLLIAASPGALGGIRGLCHARQPLDALGMHVYPGMLSVPSANNAFDEQGVFKDPAQAEKLRNLLEAFVAHAALAKV